jgi:folate-dependent phosphoribosylglycinamide formyltransferase PurN
MKRIAFLVSGSGTNMENLIKRIKAGELSDRDLQQAGC